MRVWEKSRRIGASYCEAFQSVMEAAKSREAGGQDTFYLSYNKEMTQTFIRDCAFWAKTLNVLAEKSEEIVLRDEDRDITVYRIRFASGFNVWGLPSEARSLRSKQGRVIIDEAAFVDDLPELMKAAFALLMWGGSVSILSTHNGEENPFNELLKEIRSGERNYSLHRTTLDDAIADGLFKTICKRANPPRVWSREAEEAWRAGIIADYGDGADEELFCIPNRSSGAYLTATMIEACMGDAPVLTWTPPADDFVDWPLPVAETYTRGWIAEHLARCWPACRLTRRISAAWTSDAAATYPFSGPPRKSGICAWCRPSSLSCATARTVPSSKSCSPSWTPCHALPVSPWTHGATAAPWRKPYGSSTGRNRSGRS